MPQRYLTQNRPQNVFSVLDQISNLTEDQQNALKLLLNDQRQSTQATPDHSIDNSHQLIEKYKRNFIKKHNLKFGVRSVTTAILLLIFFYMPSFWSFLNLNLSL